MFRTVRDGEPRTATSTFTQLPCSESAWYWEAVFVFLLLEKTLCSGLVSASVVRRQF